MRSFRVFLEKIKRSLSGLLSMKVQPPAWMARPMSRRFLIFLDGFVKRAA